MRAQIGHRSGITVFPSLALGRLPIATGGTISRVDHQAGEICVMAGYRPMWETGTDLWSGNVGRVTDFRLSDDDLRTVAQMYSLADCDFSIALLPGSTAAPRAVPLRDRLLFVKASLGLSAKELAEALHCSRAAIYVWLKPDYDGQTNEEAVKRLAALEQLAKSWNKHKVGGLGGHLHGMTLEEEGGKTLHALLLEAPIDVRRCEAALQAIAEQCRAQINATQRVDALVTRGFGR